MTPLARQLAAQELHQETEKLKRIIELNKTRISLSKQFQKNVTELVFNWLFILIYTGGIFFSGHYSGLNQPILVLCPNYDSWCYKLRGGLKEVSPSNLGFILDIIKASSQQSPLEKNKRRIEKK